jgi:secreted PhoX family phosphatase
VVEIRRDVRGEWQIVPGPRNRRITAATPMQISGPARGHALLHTKHSPNGTAARGTQNNCVNGFLISNDAQPRLHKALLPPTLYA